jgi:uncharacterized membrane protein
VLAILGALAIDMRKRAAMGAAYEAFIARTSFVPFAAILAGRTRLSLADLGWGRIGVAAVIYIALAYAHRWISGVTLF